MVFNRHLLRRVLEHCGGIEREVRGGGGLKGEAEPKRQTLSAVAPLTNTDKLSFPCSFKTTGDEVQLQSRCVGNASLFPTLN